jgi:omega-amidase
MIEETENPNRGADFMPQSTLQICLLQMDVSIGNPDANFAKASVMLEQAVAAEPKPDLIILPEMWNTGYALDRIQYLADPQGERTRKFIGDFCRAHQVNVLAGSVSEKKSDGVYNTAFVFNREGELAADYSKIHLFRLMDEEKHLIAGSRVGGFTLDGIQAGAMICYDIRFPEFARTLALDGAKILFVPAEWPNPRLHHWRTLLMARAIENQMFVVACNRVGTSVTAEFFGHSMVIDPWGEIVVEGGEEEAVIRAEIRLEDTERVRSTIPVFKDRRPDLYDLK